VCAFTVIAGGFWSLPIGLFVETVLFVKFPDILSLDLSVRLVLWHSNIFYAQQYAQLCQKTDNIHPAAFAEVQKDQKDMPVVEK